jgi:hypothetical protein
MNRRTLFKLLAASAAWIRAVGVRAFADPLAFTDAQLTTLRAAARAVLPSSLGAKGADEVTDRFLRWHRGYKAGVDMDHGYGFTRLRSTPVSPAAEYAKHLAELDALAREKAQTFAKLDIDAQRAIVTSVLSAAKIDALPGRPNGRHIVADLMGFYFRSTEANDLCYEAAIGKDTCRRLAGSDQPPTPLPSPAGRAREEAAHAAR